MQRTRSRGVLPSVICAVLLGVPARAAAQASAAGVSLSPVAVANAFWLEVQATPDSQVPILNRHLPVLTIDTLRPPADRLDRLSLGEAMFLSFQAREADAYFRSVLTGDDLIARHARSRVMQIRFRAFDDTLGMRALFDEFYEVYPPSPLDIHGRYQQLGNLMLAYQQLGDPGTAIALLEEEMRVVPTDAPYLSFRAPTFINPEAYQSPQGAAVVTLMRRKLVGLRATLRRWNRMDPPASSDPQLTSEMPEWYWREQGVRPGETFHAGRIRQLVGLIAELENWLGTVTAG